MQLRKHGCSEFSDEQRVLWTSLRLVLHWKSVPASFDKPEFLFPVFWWIYFCRMFSDMLSQGLFCAKCCILICDLFFPLQQDSEIISPATGKTMTLASLNRGEHPECHVPHELKALGVVVRHTCGSKPLRVTADHLIFTPTGQVQAAKLQKGDTLFRSIDQRQPCEVLSVVPEAGVQDYL